MRMLQENCCQVLKPRNWNAPSNLKKKKIEIKYRFKASHDMMINVTLPTSTCNLLGSVQCRQMCTDLGRRHVDALRIEKETFTLLFSVFKDLKRQNLSLGSSQRHWLPVFRQATTETTCKNGIFLPLGKGDQMFGGFFAFHFLLFLGIEGIELAQHPN